MKEEEKKIDDLNESKAGIKVISEDEILDDNAKEAVDGGRKVDLNEQTHVPGECNFCSPIL